jgi:hypothetical protein
MSTITDNDLQQLKDLIAAGQLATQQQITDLTLEMRLGFATVDKKMEVGFANVDTKFAHLEGKIDATNTEIKGIQNQIADIKSNQKAQDLRFWSLVFLILTSSIGLIGRLAKFY